MAQHSDPRSIRCLIFDLFDVLVSFDDTLVYQRLAGFCTDAPTALRAMQDKVSTPRLIGGEMSIEDLHATLVRQLGLSLSLPAFTAAWQAPYSAPMPGMRSLLRELRGQCVLTLLSNVDPFYWPTVRSSLPELQDFAALTLSFKQGVAKPDARAFSGAVARSGVPVESCFFVDDKVENIEAAARLGLAGQLFTSCNALKPVLRECGFVLR